MAKRKKTNEQTTITIADIGFPVYVPLFTCSQSFFFFYHILLSNLLTMNELGEGCYRSVPRALSYLHLY
jgi:hypothetical protein